jgi:hypothetical protein
VAQKLQQLGQKIKGPCWGCCSVASSSYTSNRPSSTSSAARKAASLLQSLLGHVTAATLAGSDWLAILGLQPEALDACDATDHAAAAAALRQLQRSVLMRLWKAKSRADVAGAGAATAQPRVAALLQQLLQAALAGGSDAQNLVERLQTTTAGRKVLLQHVPALVAVLQAEPWLLPQQPQGAEEQLLLQQQEGQQQHVISQQQPQEAQPSGLFAFSILCKLVQQQKEAAVVRGLCVSLPAYLQQLVLGSTAASAEDGSTDAEAAAAGPVATDTSAEATAAFLHWLLLRKPGLGVAAANKLVLQHVMHTAPALVLAALQQESGAFGPQSLFARLVESGNGNGNSRAYLTPLIKVAATRQQRELQQLVTALLQYAIGDSSSNSSSSSNNCSTVELPLLTRESASALNIMLGPSRAAADALRSVLSQQPQQQLLLQALHNAVIHGPDDAHCNRVGRLAQLIMLAVLDREDEQQAAAAVQMQLDTMLQQFMDVALEQGNVRAVKALAVLHIAQQNEVLQQVPALLRAVAPGQPAAVQSAGWQLLEAWVSSEEGCTALLQQQGWLCILDVMTQ